MRPPQRVVPLVQRPQEPGSPHFALIAAEKGPTTMSLPESRRTSGVSSEPKWRVMATSRGTAPRRPVSAHAAGADASTTTCGADRCLLSGA
ncbi:hypothetical protein ACFQXA_02810 [Nocardiopsis composta]